MSEISRTAHVEVSSEQQERIDMVRYRFDKLIKELDLLVKPSRETSLGYTKLEESLFWFIKGISREGE